MQPARQRFLHYLVYNLCITLIIASCKKDLPPADNNIIDPPDPTVTAPQVSTQNTVAVYSMSAVLAGTVTDTGSATVTERGICFDSLPGPTILKTKLQAGSGLGSFTAAATGLLPHKQYYARAFAVNTGGVSYGNEISFTTADTIILPLGPATPLRKIIITTPGLGSDSSHFQYDANNRLIYEEYKGMVTGNYDQRIVTSVTRNNAGFITGYVRTWYNLASGQFTAQETAVVQHNPSNGQYISKVSHYTHGAGAWDRLYDSVLYTYNSNQVATGEFRYTRFTLTPNNLDSAHKTTFIYAGGNELVRVKSWYWDLVNTDWFQEEDVQFSNYDLKTNPLQVPDYALVVEFMLQEAEGPLLNWNWQSMTPYNLEQAISGTTYANPTYTYINDLPVTRTYINISVTINTLQYFY